jgi:hypothetical protein
MGRAHLIRTGVILFDEPASALFASPKTPRVPEFPSKTLSD